MQPLADIDFIRLNRALNVGHVLGGVEDFHIAALYDGLLFIVCDDRRFSRLLSPKLLSSFFMLLWI